MKVASSPLFMCGSRSTSQNLTPPPANLSGARNQHFSPHVDVQYGIVIMSHQPSEKKRTQEKILLRRRILVFNFDSPDVLPSLGRQAWIFLLPGRQAHSR